MMSTIYTKEMRQEIYKDSQKNVYDFIRESVKGYEDYTALTYFDRVISYRDYMIQVNQYADRLRSLGLRKGDVISLVLGNTPETVYYFYAAWAIGCIICPLDPRTNPEGILDSIQRSKARILCVLFDVFSTKITPIFDRLNVEKIIVVNLTDEMPSSLKGFIGKRIYSKRIKKLKQEDKYFSSTKVVLNKDFLKNASTVEVQTVYEKTEQGMPAAHIFTSGTEGNPKAAVHTHEAYIRKSKQVKYALPKDLPGDTFLGIIPFFSAYGTFNGLNNSLARAMNVILIPTFKTSEFVELVCKHKPNTLIAVPNHWHDFSLQIESLMKKYKISDLSFIKYPISGGDKQPSADVFACNELFRKHGSEAMLIRGYGSTEVAGAVATTIANEDLEDGEYSGVLFPGTKYKLMDPNTKEISDSVQEGELLVSDPAMMIGYYDNDEETKRNMVEIDGIRYFNMGDLFRIDDKGRLYFCGRSKRVVIRPDGHTVHVLPIEDSLTNSGLVDQCCVVGLKKENMTGTIPTAFIKLKDGVVESQETINKLDSQQLKDLSERNRALVFVFVKELPKTLMDKIDFRKLESLDLSELTYHIVDNCFFI